MATPVPTGSEIQPRELADLLRGIGNAALDADREIAAILHDAQHRLEGRKRVIGDLRLGSAGRGEERGFAGIGQPEEADVRDQSQLQPEPGGLPRLRPARQSEASAASTS